MYVLQSSLVVRGITTSHPFLAEKDSMRKVLMTGALIGLAAAAAILLSGVLGQSLQHLGVLAVVLGAVIALAAGRTWWGAPAGLGIGMLVAWVGYGLRALLLPDATAGRAVAALLVILVTTVVVALAGGRIPLWSGLLGVAAMIAGYEQSYKEAPSAFLSESPAAFTTMLVGLGLGYLAATLAHQFMSGQGETHRRADVTPEPELDGDLAILGEGRS